MARPCGVIISMNEIIGGESVCQVSEVIEFYLQNNNSAVTVSAPISGGT